MLYDSVWLHKVISLIKDGSIDKATQGNVTVYRVKDVIRIDIKPKE